MSVQLMVPDDVEVARSGPMNATTFVEWFGDGLGMLYFKSALRAMERVAQKDGAPLGAMLAFTGGLRGMNVVGVTGFVGNSVHDWVEVIQ